MRRYAGREAVPLWRGNTRIGSRPAGCELGPVRPHKHDAQHIFDPRQLVVHREDALLQRGEPALHAAELCLHGVEPMFHVREALLHELKTLLKAEGTEVDLILAADEGVQLVMRANGERTFGVAFQTDENVV